MSLVQCQHQVHRIAKPPREFVPRFARVELCYWFQGFPSGHQVSVLFYGFIAVAAAEFCLFWLAVDLCKLAIGFRICATPAAEFGVVAAGSCKPKNQHFVLVLNNQD